MSAASIAASWPGCAPTLDAVMWEMRKLSERLACYAGLARIDADLLKQIAAHHDAPERNPFPAVTPREKSAFVRQAEAVLLFGSYMDKEAQRLAEKAHAMEQGTLDVEADAALRAANEEIAHRAIQIAESLPASHPSQITGEQ